MEVLLVLTNLPSRNAAEKLAHAVVGARAAACVNILSSCKSVYRWQDAVQEEEEHPVLIKTTRAAYAELERLIRINHPYELPEIITLPVTAGLPAYLDWVAKETGQ